MAIVGFILWNHYSNAKLTAPSTLVVVSLFIASFTFLISGILLMFPTAKFTSPDPLIPATPYAIQGTILVWTGAVLLMVSIISFFKKLKQALEYIRTYFKSKGAFGANKTDYPLKSSASFP